MKIDKEHNRYMSRINIFISVPLSIPLRKFNFMAIESTNCKLILQSLPIIGEAKALSS